MSWETSSPMDQRKEFIERWLKHDMPVNRLCSEFGKTAYKIIGRFRADGMNGLDDMSRRPNSHPTTTRST